MRKLAVHVALNTGRLPLTREKTGRIPGRIGTPLSGLGNYGYLLENYEVNVFTYPYS